MSIKLEKASSKQLDDIMDILNKGIAHLQAAQSPQWSKHDGPTESELLQEIQTGTVYTLTLNKKVIATAILTPEKQPAYANITYGNWQTTSEVYLSIHRFALDPAFGGKGYATLFLKLLVTLAQADGATDIRIDTHPLNQAMQRVILANDFTFRGIVTLPIENGERYAYQLVSASNAKIS